VPFASSSHYFIDRRHEALQHRQRQNPEAREAREKRDTHPEEDQWMARIADERFSMHRSTQILRTVRGNNDQTHQDRYRATTRRKVAFQAGHRQPTPRQPSGKQLCAVLPRSGPHNSTRPQLVSRVQRVSFRPDVTVLLTIMTELLTGHLSHSSVPCFNTEYEKLNLFYHLFYPKYIECLFV